jgi:hypothetical protein
MAPSKRVCVLTWDPLRAGQVALLTLTGLGHMSGLTLLSDLSCSLAEGKS